MSVILTFFLLFCQTLFSPIFYLLSFFLYFSMIYIFFPPLPFSFFLLLPFSFSLLSLSKFIFLLNDKKGENYSTSEKYLLCFRNFV